MAEELETQAKTIKRSSTLPLYSPLLLLNQKTKYKNKKIYHYNSSQKINENSETSGLTRINTNNHSNAQIISLKGKKPKGRVTFAPSYRLINYINYNPKDSIHINDKNNNNNQNQRNAQKLNEANTVCIHCTCIVF